jgi:hypothetical protein
MGLFADRVGKSTVGVRQNFIKDEKKYWVMIENGLEGKAPYKGFDFIRYQGPIIKVLDGGSHPPMEVVDFMFKAGQKGAEGRCKEFVLMTAGCTEEHVKKIDDASATHAINASIDPAHQALRGCVIEVQGNKITTVETKKEITAVAVKRRVPASEVYAAWESLDPKVKAHLQDRIAKMVEKENAEKAVPAAK